MTRVSDEGAGRFYVEVDGTRKGGPKSQHAALRAAQSYGEHGHDVNVYKIRDGKPDLWIVGWRNGKIRRMT